MSEQYENHGDVNPLMHGGIWVKQTEINEYDIIKYDPESNSIYDLLVNITDSWLEKSGIMSYIGMTNKTFDPLQYAIGCTEYYSYENFGTAFDNMTEAEVINFLKLRGIIIS